MILGRLFWTENSARIDSVDFPRVTMLRTLPRGSFGDMGSAPQKDFMKAAVRIQSILLSCRDELLLWFLFMSAASGTNRAEILIFKLS
ncbi:hypothetical protein METP3_02056 [Methanosarcinales archaeon]|nr:hypothetical protein METP3_02056 [Methanosarcinales archaeon]